eukprot:1160494-Pelagomonas_calceolata.AAC.8
MRGRQPTQWQVLAGAPRPQAVQPRTLPFKQDCPLLTLGARLPRQQRQGLHSSQGALREKVGQRLQQLEAVHGVCQQLAGRGAALSGRTHQQMNHLECGVSNKMQGNTCATGCMGNAGGGV